MAIEHTKNGIYLTGEQYMRDIDRIDEILKLLAKFWKKSENVDLRLGQLLSNMTNKDVFYLEDEEIIKWLEKELNK